MSINDNDPPKLVLHPEFGEPDQMLNMRSWLQKACEAQGAQMTGGGIGMREADIDIELEGHLFNVRIKPIVPVTYNPHSIARNSLRGAAAVSDDPRLTPWRDEAKPVECDLCGWKGRRIKARSAPCPSCGNGKVQFA